MIRAITARSLLNNRHLNKFLPSNFSRKMSQQTKLNNRIEAALIDLSGTLHVEDEAIGNAVPALAKLREAQVKVRFVTNTTKESGNTLYDRLVKLGFQLEREEIWSSLTAATKYIESNNLNPFYIASDDALSQLPAADETKPFNAVVVGLAPEKFNFDEFNKALDVLRKEGKLIAIHAGRFYKTSQGYAIGPGFVTKGLEYSASVSSVVIGKPDPQFFLSGKPDGVDPSNCVMIGDDPNDDIEGAKAVGMQTILVKTGKYAGYKTPPQVDTVLAKDFEEAVEIILNSRK